MGNHLQGDACTSEGADRINGHLSGIVHKLQGTPKYAQHGEGGFISTCNLHSFYKYDEFFHYAIDGVTAAEAVSQWWKATKDHSPMWHLPCTLKRKAPYQCESSCNYR